MHLKLLVIDEKETLIGSANMTGESLRMHGNLVTVIASPSVARAVLDKAAGMIYSEMNEGFPHQEFVVGGQRMELWFLPDDPHAGKRLIDLMRSTKKNLRIAMFTWTRQDFAKEVIHAHRRGVDAIAIIDQNSGSGAGKDVVDALETGGVPVFLSDGNALLHYKLMCVDDQTLVNGSANWTRAAFTKNDDCFIVLHDLNEQQKSVINSLWNNIYRQSQEIYEQIR
ncbi:phospholipase D domain protein [Necator americanus]|uniref:Mitochondrial cardiolipin hydrolase n=1 Tax=Necator americanus TaxID=51031 RepID=W2SRE1_NECAM|nr:phospholipase D domain protein [Necator americanus]ETN71426.1 phospholipase D domain protein [Necator americanus]